jgi:glutathione synthase/RimK-type ligase-like ATP-grasp enzyme
VLASEPLFVCQYCMARGHWQIVKHRAARPIGEGSYGVDIKQTDQASSVNDNPNLEHGIEDQVGKDEVWMKLLRWFIERFEQ